GKQVQVHHHQDLHAGDLHHHHMKDVNIPISDGFGGGGGAMEELEDQEDNLGVDPSEMWLDDNDQETALLADVNDPSIFYNDHFPPLPDFPCMSSSSSSSSTPAPVKSATSSSTSSSVSSSSSAASWAILRSDAEEDGERRNHHNSYNHLHQYSQVMITTKDADIVAQDPFQNPNPNTSPRVLESNPACSFTQTPWMAPPPHAAYDQAGGILVPTPPPAAYPSMMGYIAPDQYVNGPGPYQPSPEYHHMIDSGQPTWPSSPFGMGTAHYGSFPDNNIHLAPPPQHHPQAFAGYGSQYQPYQYFPLNGEHQLMRLGSSATKEARKKRMARQRRLVSHHRHGHQQQQQHLNAQMPDHLLHQQHTRLVGNAADLNCTNSVPLQANPGNWFYWPTATAAPSPSPAMMPSITQEAAPPPPVQQMDRPASTQAQNYNQGRSSAAQERRQGWKSEKNLKFLLQKVLKQSDVGSLGRIVLPKEAETHLPELEARDGISIPMEDIGTSHVWNMRYRYSTNIESINVHAMYWPNNKSRMYLLENTGDFVRANGLQEGDFIVIYSDVKCNKYMIRGVKVRHAGPKSEGNKRPGKSQRNQHASTPAGTNGSSPSSASASATHKKQ
ncbi:AP2/B3-like transcriptional factor family protein, partial [Prunus dulcis]